ncbi:sodium-coupled neutral amino acid transporter 9 isoform X2 [Monomorium pharaonis]|uniref:sodium-coupled neutral amino acid transporter 9 isoform X2 n=1 Tax=Monomorium pharaonis TaxID=307658 RepID=UPI00102E18D1|nr:sodium-coupled neutral amino acid transporter 9 isoform X2 [Monomorium pharaonis]
MRVLSQGFRDIMFKSRVYPGSDSSLTPDSGSESTPLLSSESCTSPEPAIFGDSETSDLDPSPIHCSYIYGSVDSASFKTILTVPNKSFSSTCGSELFVSTMVTSPCIVNLDHEKNYQPRSVDLIITNEGSNAKTKMYDHKPGPLEFPPDITQTPCKDDKKQNSLVTIFSIWNTILGSSLLTMPWGILMAGFFPGIIINLMMSGLCLYTAYRLIAAHAYHGGGANVEVLDLFRIYLGKWAEQVARIFSIAILLGSTIAYWILMANFLYNSVNFIYDSITGWSTHPVSENITYKEVLCPKETRDNNTIVIYEKTFDSLGPAWDLRNTVPVFLALLIFPLLNFNSTTFFTKFNSLGTISIMYVIVFVVIKSASWGINMDQNEWATNWVIKSTFPALTGMLAMSFFIHNIIVNIMQNNRDQAKNGRDLTIAYILVTFTYITVGVAFYMCFPLSKSCVEDNLLNNFQKWDGLTIGVRILLLFQLMTVYPLIAYILRIQLLSWICKGTSNRGLVLLINFVLISICIIFATFVPYIGTVVRYTGALSGLIYVFTFPNLLHLSILKKEGKLSVCTILFHLSIPIIGILNLIAQFFIATR